jgi:ribosomal protein L19E
MTNLRLQKRLAASIKGVGKRRVWLDPNETATISVANSRQAVRKLIKDNHIYVKPVKVHSRARKHKRDAAVRKGRHTGTGKRKGSSNARLPVKVIWMRRTRILRRMLARYRTQKKIDKHQCVGERGARRRRWLGRGAAGDARTRVGAGGRAAIAASPRWQLSCLLSLTSTAPHPPLVFRTPQVPRPVPPGQGRALQDQARAHGADPPAQGRGVARQGHQRPGQHGQDQGREQEDPED